MWWMLMMPAATACRTSQDNATQRLCILEWGMAAELITNLLSPSTIVGPSIGTLRHRSARHKSMTCSVHAVAATCFEPNVAVSTVNCNLEDQSIGVLLSWWRMPVTDLQLIRLWWRCNTLICVQLAMHRVSSYGTHRVVTHSQKMRFSAYRTSCY